MENQNNNNNNGFYGLGIAPALIQVLDKQKFKIPTPIQEKAIPIANESKDLVGIAQTGTGKTLAFGVPMIQKLLQKEGRGLILVPTRELALQVDETLRKLGEPFNVRSVIVIGGMNMGTQVAVMKKPNVRVIIATPGRLLDHLKQKTAHLQDIQMLVLDEADRMFDMGFAPQVREIAKFLPKDHRQTLLFSATMPDAVVQMASSFMELPMRIEIAKAGTPAEKINQEVFIVKPGSKKPLLMSLLKENKGSVLIFTRTKSEARHITHLLRDGKHQAAEIHSDRSLGQRRAALDGFKSGKYRILVATDIAARGIDVKGIELVINYDLPDDVDNYVHRIGRTGRAGLGGRAVTFATPDQAHEVRSIERLTGRAIEVAKHPEFSQEEGFERKGGSGGGRSFGRKGHKGFGGHREKRGFDRPWKKNKFEHSENRKPDFKRNDDAFSEDDNRGNKQQDHSPRERSFQDKGERKFDRGPRDRGFGDRPRRSFGDRNRRPFGDRDRNRSSFGEKREFGRPGGEKREFGRPGGFSKPRRFGAGNSFGGPRRDGQSSGGGFSRDGRNKPFGFSKPSGFGNRSGGGRDFRRGNRDEGRSFSKEKPKSGFFTQFFKKKKRDDQE